MEDKISEIRGFKTTFTVIGVVYAAMAISFVMQGPGVMRDFGVPESLIAEPVLQDFFSFFYQLMAVVGVLMVLFGHVVKTRGAQVLVSSVFVVLNLLAAARDLSVSDSRFGNHLYRGEKTVVFVYISLVLACAFGWLAARGLRKGVRPLLITSPKP